MLEGVFYGQMLPALFQNKCFFPSHPGISVSPFLLNESYLSLISQYYCFLSLYFFTTSPYFPHPLGSGYCFCTFWDYVYFANKVIELQRNQVTVKRSPSKSQNRTQDLVYLPEVGKVRKNSFVRCQRGCINITRGCVKSEVFGGLRKKVMQLWS